MHDDTQAQRVHTQQPIERVTCGIRTQDYSPGRIATLVLKRANVQFLMSQR